MTRYEEEQAEYKALVDTPAGQSILSKNTPSAVEAQEGKKTKSSLVSLDSIEPQAPRYFWYPYIRLGNLNILRGDGGTGKTMLAFAIMAAVTTGKQPDNMPGKLQCGQSAVIYYGAEDDLCEYANRAVLCGCDRRYLHVVADGNTLPQLSDIVSFRHEIKEKGAKLIVFDPVQSFLGASTDMNRANEIRPLLDGLRALCRQLDVTVIIVEHLNKSVQQKAHYRGIGSVDFINASRSTLMVGYHPSIRGISVAVHVKANAEYGQPIAFSIDDDGRFSWQSVCDVTEDEVAQARRYKKGESPAEVADPVLAMVIALMDKYPDGWTGTATQLLDESSKLVNCPQVDSPVTIGKKLKGIRHELVTRGISWKVLKSKHSFTKIPQQEILNVGEDRQDKQDK